MPTKENIAKQEADLVRLTTDAAERFPESRKSLLSHLEQFQALQKVLATVNPNLTQGNVDLAEDLAGRLRNAPIWQRETELPIEANISRTFLLAKLKLQKRLLLAHKAAASDDALVAHLSSSLAHSVYTLLGKRILLDIACHDDVSWQYSVNAVVELMKCWDDARLEIDDFCPVLEAAWIARQSCSAKLGSMIGTTEYFQLAAQDCPDKFLDFFTQDNTEPSLRQAFEEFLFDMTYEELQEINAEMVDQNIDTATPQWCSQVLSREVDDSDHTAMEQFYSYLRREAAARQRVRQKRPGPSHTAEGYLMIHLLLAQEP